MQVVGHHLDVQAVAASNADKDAFARSAFNRYYYSAFLTIREMLSKMDPAWAGLGHASYPDILTGNIRKSLKRARRRASKNDDDDLVEKIDKAVRSIHELTSIIRTAYAVRVIADYQPEEVICFTNAGRFTLRSVSATDAYDWESTSRAHCGSVYQAWSEVHG